jgi:phospho-N-acetylmuramoyl-pentapeptide-transferase
MEYPIFSILIPATLAFIFGIILTPLLTHYLYKFKVWKKTGGKMALNGTVATEFNRLKGEGELKTPRMGGIVIWGSVLITIGFIYILKLLFPTSVFDELFFISRSETWIPFTTLIIGAGVGFLNDYYDVVHGGKGLRLSVRILIITALSGFIGWWFYAKLGIDSVGIPFDGSVYIGWLIIPFFIFTTISLYASGVIDGIDGLSGGVFSTIFLSYAGIAFNQSQYDLAAFCATLAGGILAFLWFNIPPARFWMTETGSMALTLTLAVVVFMTDELGDGKGILLLPLIGLPLVATAASVLAQVTYKKATGRKLFMIAPLHHHFEAIGWPSTKVVMRYWVISIMCAIAGLAIATVA